MTPETKRNLVVGILLGLVAGLGGAWAALAYQRGQAAQRVERVQADYEARLAELRGQLTFAQLHLQLGEVMLQAHRNNFGVAQRQSAHLFQRLGEFSRTGEHPQLAERTRGLAERQGEILGDLSALSPVAAEKLGDTYLEWRQAAGQWPPARGSN